MEKSPVIGHKWWNILAGSFVLLGLYWSSLYSYILFHSIAEIFSIVIACGIFMIAWNARRYLENDYLLFLGMAYLFIAGIDLLHTLAYKGMGVFPGYGSNLATQLWISARYMESLSLLIAPVFLRGKIRVEIVNFFYAAATALLLASMFYWEIFPTCYVEGIGLTPFKVISEYVICLILVGSMVFLLRKRSSFDSYVLRLLLASIILTIAEEMAFTFYISVYGFSNLIGHFFKILSFYLIYKAIIETGFEKPYSLIFKEIKESEAAFRTSRDQFKFQAVERTAELLNACRKLKKQIIERKRAQESMQASEKKYSTLVESSLTGIFMIQDGKIIFANNRFAKIHGYSKEELLGMDPYKLVHLDDMAVIREFRQRRLRGEKVPSEYEIRGLKKGGETIWVQRRVALTSYNEKPAVLVNVVDITERKQMEEDLRRSEKALRNLSAQLLKAQEEESKRIALELHDGIGQSLSAIKIRVESAIEQMSSDSQVKSTDSLRPIIPMVQEAVEEVRRISRNLRPSILDDLGILATISWFCREAETVYSKIHIERHIHIEEKDIPEPLKIVIFRILQEAVNNTAKHSQADLVGISLKGNEEEIQFSITDNGVGFDVEGVLSNEHVKRGLGLASMKERTEQAGGSFVIESQVGGGTSICTTWLRH